MADPVLPATPAPAQTPPSSPPPAAAPAAASPAPSPAPASPPPVPGSAPASAATGAGAPGGAPDPSGAPPGGTPAQQQAQWLASLRAKGIPVPEDEGTATNMLAGLWQRNQQFQQVQPHFQQYLANQKAFQDWQAAQQKTQQQPGQKPWYSEFYQPPEYNPQWESMLTRDADGNITALPGTPPDVLAKYQQWASFRQQQVQKFANNPYEFMEPAIKHLAKQIAEETIGQRLGQQSEVQFAKNFLAENAGWLYERTPQGQAAVDPMTWQPLLSKWGNSFRDYVQEAEQKLGIKTAEGQQKYALALVQRDYAIANQQQAPAAPAAPAAPQQTALQQANGAFLQNLGGGNPTTPPSQPVPPNQPLNLGAMLRKGFKANGITDQALQGR